MIGFLTEGHVVEEMVESMIEMIAKALSSLFENYLAHRDSVQYLRVPEQRQEQAGIWWLNPPAEEL